ncbi:MAG TPA: signal peptidase I [Thermomicrobiales bacterium]|nr:signal peptidase I [Thermomicrobiales bacterium]
MDVQDDERRERAGVENPAAAGMAAGAEGPRDKATGRSLVREVAELAIIVLVVFFGLRLVLMPYEVDGASMDPFLENGEHLFVNRLAYADVNLTSWMNVIPGVDVGKGDALTLGEPKRGDIVVLNPPVSSDSPYVKRVVALPGETIGFHDGIVFVDGKPLAESYIEGAITFCHNAQWCSLTVPADSVYVLGDNREHSSDSRAFGPVKISRIVGKVFFTNWPTDRFGPVKSPDYDDTAP